MKKIQVYFIHQCQIQYYDYNATEESCEILSQNLLGEFR
jgi:hypothetical protein